MNQDSSSYNDPEIITDEQLEQWLNGLPSAPQQDDIEALMAPSITTQITAHGSSSNCHDYEFKAADEANENPSGKNREGKKKRALVAERQRRNEMTDLHRSLRMVLPAEYIKGKRAVMDQLEQAAKYISDLQENIKELNRRRDELIRMKPSGSSSNMSKHPHMKSSSEQRYVTVKACNGGLIEIVVTNYSAHNYLSKLLRLVSCEDLDVINTVSSRSTDDNWVYTLQALVGEGDDVDVRSLQQKLSDRL